MSDEEEDDYSAEEEPEELQETGMGDDDASSDIDDAMEDAADAADDEDDDRRRHDPDYVAYLERREEERLWDEEQRYQRTQDRARAQMGARARSGSGSKVVFVIVGVLIVCGGIGAALWAVGNAKKQTAMSEAAAALAGAQQGEPAEGEAEGEAEGVAAGASEMASISDCERMFRQGTLLKARRKRSFRRLSGARQQARLDRVMRSSKMRRAVAACPGKVPQTLATCIVNASSLAAYKACAQP